MFVVKKKYEVESVSVKDVNKLELPTGRPNWADLVNINTSTNNFNLIV